MYVEYHNKIGWKHLGRQFDIVKREDFGQNTDIILDTFFF